VQFHPEFSDVVMSKYIECRAGAIRGEGLSPGVLVSNVVDTPAASSVLKKFAAVVVDG
jgi:GMP synthase (glutamine-hydrolysing)